MGRLSKVLGVWRRARIVSNVRRQAIVVCNECNRHFTTTRYVCMLAYSFKYHHTILGGGGGGGRGNA